MLPGIIDKSLILYSNRDQDGNNNDRNTEVEELALDHKPRDDDGDI
jgi:hypothetical protein